MNVTDQVLQLLDSKKIKYSTYTHPICRTSEESYIARINAGAPEAIGAKALLLKADCYNKDTKWIMVVIPGFHKFESKRLKPYCQDIKKLRFAHADEIAYNLHGLVPGSIPPFGPVLFQKVDTILVDEALFNYSWIGFNAGSLVKSVVMDSSTYKDIEENKLIGAFSSNQDGIAYPGIKKNET